MVVCGCGFECRDDVINKYRTHKASAGSTAGNHLPLTKEDIELLYDQTGLVRQEGNRVVLVQKGGVNLLTTDQHPNVS